MVGADENKKGNAVMSETVLHAKDTTNRNLGKKQQQCRICGAAGEFQSWTSREMMQGKRTEFEYFECPVCECLQIAEIPNDLGEYYGEDYYSFSLEEEKERQYQNPVNSMEKILDDVETRVRAAKLFDQYGALLKDNARGIFEEYFSDDLCL